MVEQYSMHLWYGQILPHHREQLQYDIESSALQALVPPDGNPRTTWIWQGGSGLPLEPNQTYQLLRGAQICYAIKSPQHTAGIPITQPYVTGRNALTQSHSGQR